MCLVSGGVDIGVAQLFNLLIALVPTAGATAVIVAAIKYGPNWIDAVRRWREDERTFVARKTKRALGSKAVDERRQKRLRKAP